MANGAGDRKMFNYEKLPDDTRKFVNAVVREQLTKMRQYAPELREISTDALEEQLIASLERGYAEIVKVGDGVAIVSHRDRFPAIFLRKEAP